MRKAPKFWYKRKGVISTLLWPVSWLYSFGAFIDQSQKSVAPYTSDAFVICVGNIVVGGAGKTPVVDYLTAKLDALDVSNAVVSRGYGGSLSEPTMVEAGRHKASEVGDEPLMLAQKGRSVWVGDNRAKTTAQAASMARVIVTDDGLQDPSLTKDKIIAVFDGGVGVGNGLGVPAGPLRTSLKDLQADAAVIIGQDKTNLMGRLPKEIEVFLAEMRLDRMAIAKLDGKSCCAFAGIGRPEKFFESCEGAGVKLDQVIAFSDHHEYTDRDVERLLKIKDRGAQLITTEKDYVRLPVKLRPHVMAVPAKLTFVDDGFDKWMRRHIEASL